MKRLRWYDFISINIFWLGLNLRNSAVGAIFMPYLVDAFAPEAIRNTALGEMRTAGLVIAMLAQPLMGLLSDRNTSRFGRRRPFIFTGVMLDLLFLAGIAVAANYWQLLVAVLLIQFSSNISHGPLQALIPDLVPEDQRGRASAVKSIFELLPLVILGATIAPLVGAGHFTWAVAAAAGGLLLTMLLTVLLVKETPITVKPDVPLGPTMLRVLGMLAGIAVGAVAGLLAGALVGALAGLAVWPFLGQQSALNLMVALGGVVAMIVAVVAGVWAGVLSTLGSQARRQPSFTWWVTNRLMFLAAITSIQSFAPFFLMYAFQVDRQQAASMTGTLVMVVGIFTLTSALPSGWISDKLGQKRLIGISGLLAALGTGIVLLTIWTPNLSLIYLAGGILGLATGLFVTTNWALGTRLVPDEQAGRYLGVSNLAGAGAGIVGAGIGGPVADYLNNSLPGLGYFVIFSGYLVLFLISVVILRWINERPVALSPVEGG